MKQASKVVLNVDAGVVLQAPVWESYVGGMNFAATVVGPAEGRKGRYMRNTWQRAFGFGGGLYKLPSVLPVGAAVVFGADIPRRLGIAGNVVRWYGVVIDVTDTEITMLQYPSEDAAWQASYVMTRVGEDQSVGPLRDELGEAILQSSRDALFHAVQGVLDVTEHLPDPIAAAVLQRIAGPVA
jgi:hypothetical protein